MKIELSKQEAFTFQSGDIQMIDLLKKDLTYIRFTFQSGDIQICYKLQNDY